MLTVDISRDDGGRGLVRELCESSCAFIVGHGVPDELRARMVAVSSAFFDLPEAEKELVRWPGDGPWYGWQGIYRGFPELTGTREPEPIERFEARMTRPAAGEAAPLAEWSASFTRWPERPETFVDTWTEYYVAMRAVATHVVGLITAELDLPRDELGPWTEGQFANLVVNHYMAQPEPPPDGVLRSAAHTDQGGVTLLSADHAPGGLEMRFPGAEEWTSVLIPADAFLVQVGDLLEHWTNGRIRGNHHRVANPPSHLGPTAQRFAVVYFHYPALATEVHPAPSCLAPGELAGPPLIAGEHILLREEAYRTRAWSVE